MGMIQPTCYMIILIVIVDSASPLLVQASINNDPMVLDEYLHDHVNMVLMSNHTRSGTLYNISLPANFSGIEASYVRLRTASFWGRGANYCSVLIPPRIIPMPYTRRLTIVYENLGNWSSHFFQVPHGYHLASPIIGFHAYDSFPSSPFNNHMVDFSIIGDPIAVLFPPILLKTDKQHHVTPKCVKFDANGTSELSSMSKENVCFATNQGHFSVVVPVVTLPQKAPAELSWRWWVVGAGGVIIGLCMLGIVAMVFLRSVRKKKIREMARQAEKGVDFDTIWIGRSKMPSASMIRTQPHSMLNGDDFIP